MKKILSLAGPISGLLALKCPFCLLALAGLTAGVGSFAPVIRGIYQTLILGLSVLFMWFLFRSWRSRAAPGWVLGLGLSGFAGLIYQIATEAGGVIATGSALALSVASIASFAITARKNEAFPCCCVPKGSEPPSAKEVGNGC